MTEATSAAAAAVTLTLALAKPATLLDQEWHTLELREPRALELAVYDGPEPLAEKDRKLVAFVSGIPEVAIGTIGVRDFKAAIRFLDTFGLAPASSEEPSSSPASKSISLRVPVTNGAVTYSALELREPTANEFIAWDAQQGVTADIALIASISGIPEVAVRQVAARDFVEAAAYLADFLVAAPKAAGAS